MTAAKAPARRRDAAGSRQALLEAARTLFTERGFERTTIRDIGEQAGLDPTLIARYFGNKAALYLEILRSDFAGQGAPADLLQPGRLMELLDRISKRGPGPIVDSALRTHGDPAVQREARAALAERVVNPLQRRVSSASVPDAALRAEIIAAAFIGIAVGRHSGAFPSLSDARVEQVAELAAQAFGALAETPS